MPRIAGISPPKYRKHKASGQAVVTINGKDCYLGPHGSLASRREYDRLIREWYASGGVVDQADDFTVVELLAAFMRHVQQEYGPHSTEPANYRAVVKRFGKAYGKTLASEFGPLRLKAFRESLIKEKLSRTTINHAINRLRHIFKWGVENELVRPEILASLKCVAGLRFGKGHARETEPVKPVVDAFVDATIAYCSPQVAAMIQLQRVTGMRSGEVCRMRTVDINLQGGVWTYTPARHKTLYRGHARVVFLGPKAQEILRPWLRPDLQAYLFQPAEAEAWRRQQRSANRKTPLSCGNRPGTNRKSRPRRKPGSGYTPQSYGKAVLYALQKCNRARAAKGESEIPHWHPHQLRHNAATQYRREHGLEVARVLLGHKHAAITEIYAEADRERAVQVVANIG
jgi:integrase